VISDAGSDDQQVSVNDGLILFNEVTDRLAPVVAQLQAQAPSGTQPPAATSMQDLPEQVRQLLAPPIADAYASTFVWALVLLALSLIPALLRLRGKNTPAEPAVPEPVGDGDRR
jgi:hypothetical protein